MLIINEGVYQKLPIDLQAILNYNAIKLQDFIVKMILENDKLALNTLKEKGMSIVEDVDIKPFRKKIAPVYEKWEKKIDPKTWKALGKYTSIGK
jgi:TRAP-type C4-dicarboxylate transport system substrate-binding protein